MQHSGSTKDKPTDKQTAVVAARLAYVFKGLPVSLLVSAMLAAMTVASLVGAITLQRALIWYGVFLTICGGRTLLYRSYQRALRSSQPIDLPGFERRFNIGTLCAGIAWGSLSVVMFPDDATLQVFIAFVIAGSAAGAVTTLSALRPAAFAFVLTSVAPLGVRLLLVGTELSIAMSLMVAAFLVVISTSINRLHAQFVELVTARVDADLHLRELTSAQSTVQELNERLTIATQTAKLGVWEWHPSNNLLLCDARMRDMYAALPQDDLNYEVFRQRIHPHDLARIDTALQAIRTGGQDLNEEFRLVWPNGAERMIRAAASVQRGHDGRGMRIIGVNWDITEIKRLDRMKGEFVSIVSHELRTPLTSIRGSLGLLTAGVAGAVSEKAQELLQLADRNAERLATLIDDILDMEKMESGKLRLDVRTQSLMPLIDQAIEANAGYAQRYDVRLTIVARAASAWVEVDALRFLQVMANLLSNATKFSPPKAAVEISVITHGKTVRIAVRDRGPGLSEEFQTRIFGKFSQGDSSDARVQGGTGLGLAISKALIEQMGGHIGYETEPGKGTTFFLDLPLLEGIEAVNWQQMRTNIVNGRPEPEIF